MQARYEPNFKTLTNEEADYFADAIVGSLQRNFLTEDTTGGEALFNDLRMNDIDHKTACMSLANDPSIMAITILEKVVGKEIVKKANIAPANVRAPRVQRDGAPRPKVIKNDPRVIYDVIPNPKRMGSASYDRYNFYKEGMTVQEFITAGGTAGDIKHDVSKGFIKLKDAE